MLDPLGTRDALLALIRPAIPWATLYATSRPVAYVAPAPWGVFIPYHLGVAARESQETGNPAGDFNCWVLTYLEQPYGSGAKDEEELRVLTSFVAVANALLTPDGDGGCVAGIETVARVTYEVESRDGPYVSYVGKTWIGARFLIYTEERYA